MSEPTPQPMRVIDHEALKTKLALYEAACAKAASNGQKILARIRPSSKYFGQGTKNALFPVAITHYADYAVAGGPGGQYRLKDVDLFVVFEHAAGTPIQITYELSSSAP